MACQRLLGVEWAQLISGPPPSIARKRRRYTEVQKRGLRYERRVHRYFAQTYGWRFIPGPWFRFVEAATGSVRFCQADGLIFEPERAKITIVEVKLRHTNAACRQLFDLYRPVVRKLFPAYDIGCCEITEWFDPAIPIERPVRLCRVPEHVDADIMGVHICRPERQ